MLSSRNSEKNIHFELFEEFNDDIYPVEKEFPLLENVELEFKMLGKEYTTILPTNEERILQQFLYRNFRFRIPVNRNLRKL
jgi:ring-1,2-phenylacetyl-CoA epoxidase subunit PaaE